MGPVAAARGREGGAPAGGGREDAFGRALDRPGARRRRRLLARPCPDRGAGRRGSPRAVHADAQDHHVGRFLGRPVRCRRTHGAAHPSSLWQGARRRSQSLGARCDRAPPARRLQPARRPGRQVAGGIGPHSGRNRQRPRLPDLAYLPQHALHRPAAAQGPAGHLGDRPVRLGRHQHCTQRAPTGFRRHARASRTVRRRAAPVQRPHHQPYTRRLHGLQQLHPYLSRRLDGGDRRAARRDQQPGAQRNLVRGPGPAGRHRLRRRRHHDVRKAHYGIVRADPGGCQDARDRRHSRAGPLRRAGSRPATARPARRRREAGAPERGAPGAGGRARDPAGQRARGAARGGKPEPRQG